MSLSCDTKLFSSLLDAPAPRPLREIPSAGEVPEGVVLRELTFESLIPSPDLSEAPRANEVYAIVAGPIGEGPFPGILLLHGGMGHADRGEALSWAAKGYVVVAPDLPGIADPAKAPHSRGEWTTLAYGANRWVVDPNISHSTIFQGITAALQAFALLREDGRVDASRLGVTGTSWGGYSTTMVCGLLGRQVRAAFSNYGAGFYEYTTFADALGATPSFKETWLAALDAGRRASGIEAAFFIAGAANDTFFYPPAVEKTLAAIPRETNHVHAPNAHHELPIPGGVNQCGGSAAMAAEWFAWHLRGEGTLFPSPRVLTATEDLPLARFKVSSSTEPSAVSVWWSLPAADHKWPQRVWMEAPVKSCGDGEYQASFSPDALQPGAVWFALVSEARGVSVSTPMQILAQTPHGLEFRPLAQV